MKILAIDPGFDRLGLAVLEGTASKPVLVWSTCVLPPKGDAEARLSCVHKAVADAITLHAPTRTALETLFFSTNKKTALSVAEARGAVLSAIGEAGLPVAEFSPGTVKLAVTGNGRSDKKSVAKMVSLLVSPPARRRYDDELDAIAIGITALSHQYPQP